MVLIFSSVDDLHARMVIKELEKLGTPHYLWDLSNFPARQRLSIKYTNQGPQVELKDEDKLMNLSKVTAAWWRRPQPFGMDKEIKDPVNMQFAYGECEAAIHGMLPLLNARWMNRPVKDEAASRKAYQLEVARNLGLAVPDTLITTDKEAALEFIEKQGEGRVIYKSFSALEQAWRETRLVKEDELRKIGNVKFAPVIFQKYIEAAADLRITVVGDEIYPAAIITPESSYQIDFRMTYTTSKIVKHDLPEEICNRLRRLMRRLGLIYGAIDMRLTPTGEYIFLEVNTAGQWLFMEEPTGLPISKAIARWLTGDAVENVNGKMKYAGMAV